VGFTSPIQCNIRDITEHKRIVVALQENEKKYHDLVSQSTDGIFIFELSGQILTVNEAMCKELAFSKEEFLSMSIWTSSGKIFGTIRLRLTKILEQESIGRPKNTRCRGKNGKLHYVDVISVPRYSGKDMIGFQGIARDITTRKRAEQEIHRQLDHFKVLSVIDRAIAANFDLRSACRKFLPM